MTCFVFKDVAMNNGNDFKIHVFSDNGIDIYDIDAALMINIEKMELRFLLFFCLAFSSSHCWLFIA